MNSTKIVLIIGLLVILGCSDNPPGNIEQWKQEVADTEKAFNDMAQEKGLVEAFAHFAAEDGVIRRSRKIVKGKEEIRKWYEKDVRPNETLTWTPTFIDVSKSGDLAYTYGDFTFTSFDSLGNEKTNQGIFHTVWKRQADNTWRFVWD